ncbi:hypothetical protein [Blastopirellula retiformator]|uniref:Uncharacterized protein n=1 Tax=Blastopirellula retiformator TaxID=2527970 RepID=A0A5C5V2P7_9BACT|nr:hypothetical protein [Blastopirellula retiformator]TWT32778.1 hypothetical protein Enr8_25840 [Blastopirellula retiformator]
MHAAALLMCEIVAGADVRESIATPQAMSDLLTSELAIPAADYFSARPAVVVTKEKAQ